MTVQKMKALEDEAYRLGYEYEKTYRGCAQCVFAALQDVLDLKSGEADAVFKAATGLAGGVGLEGDGHCGAYSGAVMMVSFLTGRDRTDFGDPENRRATSFALSQLLHARFIEAYGSVTCHSIHRRIMGRPFYIRDPEERRKFDKAGAHTDKCTHVVGETARWAIGILADAGLLPEGRL